MCRGHAGTHRTLFPGLDRELSGRSRRAKLALERRSIDLFRNSVRSLADGERGALEDDIVALMVLQHYGVPTRLLDWTGSPFVAAYFASGDERSPGEIWAFDSRAYARAGQDQWKKWPPTTADLSGDASKFDAKLTAFAVDEPPPWICCAFYPAGFPRQTAQAGAYTLTARLGFDHALALAQLLGDRTLYCRYRVAANVKHRLRDALRKDHGVWRGSLYPESSGVAGMVCETLFPRAHKKTPR